MIEHLQFLSDCILFRLVSDISGELNDNADEVINIIKQNRQEIIDETKTTKVSPNAVGLRAKNIRKTSISMPSKLDEMEVLRMDRQNVSRIGINRLAISFIYYVNHLIYLI